MAYRAAGGSGVGSLGGGGGVGVGGKAVNTVPAARTSPPATMT